MVIVEDLITFLTHSMYSILAEFFKDLIKSYKLKIQSEKTKVKKINVYLASSEWYYDLLKTYFDDYNEISDTWGKI